jgi:hypothetical protein
MLDGGKDNGFFYIERSRIFGFYFALLRLDNFAVVSV